MNSTISKLTQSSLSDFLVEKKKEEVPFVPIDVNRSPIPIVKKKRGCPPKNNEISGLKGSENKKSQKVEEFMLEEEEEKHNPAESENAPGSRGSYNKISFKNKLKILDLYIAFRRDPPIEDNQPMSLNSFYYSTSTSLNINKETIKSLCKQYEKCKSIYPQLEIQCRTERIARQTGQIVRRDIRLKAPEKDHELADWILCSLEMGYILTRELVKEKALELIGADDPDFKASDGWLDAFLKRHNLSLRKLNDKSKVQTAHLEELSDKFQQAVRQTIKKYKINESMVINMDESPYFWEYLLNKVIASKMARQAKGWKRNYQNARSTLVLAVTASGKMLPPTLILKRMTQYYLQTHNDIGLLLLNNAKGWIDEDLTIQWLKTILIPYVKQEHCMLIWDSFEAHISEKVIAFLEDYKNIHVGVIVGGMTAKSQPLDIMINKKFKSICKRESIRSANVLLDLFNETNAHGQTKISSDNTILKGKVTH